MRVRVEVPATSANLGPGFDVLGLALDLVNEVVAEPIGGGAIEVDPGDSSEPELRDPASNMVVRGYTAACDSLGVAAAALGVRLVCRNQIPLARGLGSSAAATLSGILAAGALHNATWSSTDIIDLAMRIEGHPDNAAAALLGGLVICAGDAAPVRIDVSEDLRCVLLIPDVRLATAEARSVVPQNFSRDDAVANLGRCALLVHALESGHHELLGEAMRDRWHQPPRSALFPALPTIIDAAQDAGAFGAALSGAGSSVIALSDTTHDCDAIAEAMEVAARVAGLGGSTVICGVRSRGAEFEVFE